MITPPKFLLSPDKEGRELYITCTNPLALIWVQQTTPAKLWIIEGEQSEQILREAGEFYKSQIKSNAN